MTNDFCVSPVEIVTGSALRSTPSTTNVCVAPTGVSLSSSSVHTHIVA